MGFFVPGLLRKSFIIERPADGAYVSGRWVPSTSDPKRIKVLDSSVQPSSEKDRELLPEGKRSRAAITIYTSTFIQWFDEKTNKQSDTIIYEGRRWEVAGVKNHYTPWEHYKAVALLVDGE